MRKVALIVALALASSAAIMPGTATAGIVGTTQTDCGQSSGYGARVCVDRTGPYGLPWVLVYSNGTTLAAAAIASTVQCGSFIPPFVATAPDVIAVQGLGTRYTPTTAWAALLPYGFLFVVVGAITGQACDNTITRTYSATADTTTLNAAYTKLAAGRPLVLVN